MKKLILTIVLAALCLFWGNASRAQTIKITGVITDQQGKTLSDATVQIVNQNIKTKSNIDGTFTINSPIQSGTLKVSYLGYHDKEVSFNVNSLKRFSIVLEKKNNVLKEFQINAGYYTVTDKERTGSISQIKAKTISQQPINNPLQALQGRVTGMEITQNTGIPGGGFSVRIRGQNSIANGNDPMYIINGVPISSTTLSSNTLNFQISSNSSPLSSINPSDIESIEILKDADATAIYGSRGANGVILITTKKGKPGALKISTNLYQGIGKVTSKIDLLNTTEYLQMRREAFKNDNQTPSSSDFEVNGIWDQTRNTDWQKTLIGGTASTSNAQISLSGGNENTTFLLSGNYYRETSVFPGDNRYQKKSSLLNLNHTSTNQSFKIQFSGSYNIEDNTLPQVDLTNSILLPPNAPALFTPSGEINWENGTFTDNPIAFLKRKYQTNTGTFTANSNFSYLLLPALELSARIGFVRMQRDELLTGPLSAQYPGYNLTNSNRTADYANNWNQTLNIEPQLSYTTKIGTGKLNILIGSTIQENRLHLQTIRGTGYVSDGLLENIIAASSISVRDASNATYRYLSAYARLNYHHKNRYFFNLTGRRDGSSRFGTENIFANFGAIGAAWIFSEETYISKHLPFLSLGKLRASYGITGNDQIGDYNYLELWSPTTYPYQGQSSLSPTRLFNPNYAWETNKKMETTLELAFLKDRLRLISSYYRNRSSNQLAQYALAPSTGFKFLTANLPATIQNSGWEFEVSGNPIQNEPFKWSASFNISLPKNKLIVFPNLEKSSYSSTYVIGHPLNIIKTLQFTGVDSNTGLYTFSDMDGNGTINRSDALNIKVLGQKFFGGLQNNLSFKRFELDFLFQFVKQTGRNYMRSIGSAPGSVTNQPKIVLNRWQKEGDISNIQKYGISSTSTPYFYGRTYGDFTISDASFIRLKNVALSYHFPQKTLSMIGASNAKIYLQAQNLATFTNFPGLDPESPMNGLSTLPTLRIITAGIQISF